MGGRATWDWMSVGGRPGQVRSWRQGAPLSGSVPPHGGAVQSRPPVGALQGEAARLPRGTGDHQFPGQAQFPLRKPGSQPLKGSPGARDSSPAEGGHLTGAGRAHRQGGASPSITHPPTRHPVPGLRCGWGGGLEGPSGAEAEDALTTPPPVLLRGGGALLITSFTPLSLAKHLPSRAPGSPDSGQEQCSEV